MLFKKIAKCRNFLQLDAISRAWSSSLRFLVIVVHDAFFILIFYSSYDMQVEYSVHEPLTSKHSWGFYYSGLHGLQWIGLGCNGLGTFVGDCWYVNRFWFANASFPPASPPPLTTASAYSPIFSINLLWLCLVTCLYVNKFSKKIFIGRLIIIKNCIWYI